jgi:hypothetical protein
MCVTETEKFFPCGTTDGGLFFGSQISIPLMAEIRTSAHQHISTSAHQHISTSAHQHISTSITLPS